MATNTVNTILAANLNWLADKNSHNELVLVFTLDSVAFDITDYTFQVNFKVPGSSTNQLELKESDFLTNGGANGRLTIPITKAQSAALVRNRYTLEVMYTYSSKEYRLLVGNLNYYTSNNPSSTSTEVPVSVQLASGQTVTIEVTLAGQILAQDSGDI